MKQRSPNPGELLFMAVHEYLHNLSDLPDWPEQLSTLNGCKEFIKQHPEYMYIVAAVHEKKAYGWLCEHIVTVGKADNAC